VTGVGHSLIIGGMTLMWKRIQILQDAFLLLVMIFAISALPVLAVPGWFTGLARVFPVTAAVASLYDVLIARRPRHRAVGAPAGWPGCWSPPPPTWPPGSLPSASANRPPKPAAHSPATDTRHPRQYR
jgi:hypothetical protein